MDSDQFSKKLGLGTMKGSEMSKNKASKQVPKPTKAETPDTGETTKDLKKPAAPPAEPEETEFKPGSDEEVNEAAQRGDWARVRELRQGKAGIFKPGKAPHRVKSKIPSV